MTSATLQRYAPGGDIYKSLADKYGNDGAQQVYAAAQTGDFNGEVNAALTAVKYGKPLNDSTADIFLDQVTSDPLAAPLESANRQLGNVFLGLLKNPFVLLAVALLVAYKLGYLDKLAKRVGLA